MKPPPFDYAAAVSVEHAAELLASGAEARVLAGGQSLMPILNLRLGAPDLLVDIRRIPDLGSIAVEGDTVVIGAAVTQAQAAASADIRAGWPLLATACSHIGHPQIRNRGTVCGSLAHNDPQAELPAVAVAMDATLRVRSVRGERRIAAADMFLGPFTTALEPDELVTAVEVPAQPAGWGFQEFAVRSGDFALAGVAVRLDRAPGGVAADPRVVLFGVAGQPVRAALVEGALDGAGPTALDEALLEQFAASLDPPEDVHGSTATRRDLAVRLVADTVNEAWERAA